MAAPSRSSQFSKVHKVLKKYYPIVPPAPNRSVFEQLVFACCLENAHYGPAEEAYAALEHSFFDWNEIRVTTVRELSEVMACLPDPPAAANRVKRVLQSIFESTYSFDLEELRKQNLGPAVDRLKKLDGTTGFSVAYVTQVALGGHAIPVDAGVLGALCAVEFITQEDVQAGVVPGLERAIAKSKGFEFASQLHQLGADFIANPYAPELHEILLEINADARQRLPKRRARKRSQSPAESAQRRAARRAARRQARAQAQKETSPRKPKRTAEQKESAEPPQAEQQSTESQKQATEGQATEGQAAQGQATEGQAAQGQAAQGQAAVPQREDTSGEDQAAPAAKKKPAAARKKPTAKKKADAGTRTSTSAGLSKRKPR